MLVYKTAGIFFGFVVAIAFMVATPSAQAQTSIPDPDFMQIKNTFAYEGTIEATDILYVMHYEIDYSTLPGPLASEAFMFRLMDGVSELRSATPFAFVNDGYSEGVISIYFTAAEVSTLGIVFGASSGYTVRLQGNPNVFSVPPVVESSSINYRSTLFTTSELKDDVEAMARDLETDWAAFTTPNISLLQATTAGNVFTSDGEDYFTNAILDLILMVPDLFTGRAIAPEFPERQFDLTFRDQLLQFWDSTAFGTTAQTFSDTFGLPRSLVYMFAVLVFMVFIAAMVVLATKSTALVPATVAVIFPMAAYIGLADLIFVALVSALATIGSVYVLWLRRA